MGDVVAAGGEAGLFGLADGVLGERPADQGEAGESRRDHQFLQHRVLLLAVRTWEDLRATACTYWGFPVRNRKLM